MRRMLILVLLVLYAGCGRVPQVHYYDLLPDPPAPAAQSGKILWVQPFSALPPTDQDRMVYRDTAWEIQFDAYRRWIAAPPELLRDRLVAWLRASGRFGAVVTAMPREEGFATLAVQLVRFDEALEGGKREAVVRFWFEGISAAGEKESTGYIEGRAAIAPGDASGIVAAMRTATQQAFAQLLEHL